MAGQLALMCGKELNQINFMNRIIQVAIIMLLPVFVLSQNKKTAKLKQRSFSSVPYWREEFNYNGLPDTTKWSYETGRSANNEIEYYTNAKNAMVRNGVLVIAAKKEKIDGMDYSSARMVTNGKADFLYGRFEIRAKLPTGRGLWPAIWMMPVKESYGGWPASGEIDIMEQVGYAPDTVHISTHTHEQNWMKNNGVTSVAFVKTATAAFHIYRIDWTPGGIEGFIDGKKIFQHLNNNKGHGYWPFDKPFFLILNIAVGGDWGGKYGVDDTIFPKQMEVDYIRVYKMKDKK
ncbi:MAG: glycoside hydrolase [Chitinophagaceae bacterium]|nr:glycoside hydrolase [Chitinophagaceae bacterium]